MKYTVSLLPEVTKIKKIFFVGIKGVGVAPLALIAKGAGIEVAGSDVDETFITDKYLLKQSIPLYTGFDEKVIDEYFSGEDPSDSLLVTTGAHKGFDNPQVVRAKKMGIKVFSQGQALSLFMDGEIFGRNDIRGISVAGSHGKTTTTSLLATTMKAMGFDPSYSVGTGEVFPLGAPGYYGRGEYFIAEADEYASEPVYDRVPKFLYQTPYIAIFNNIDFDHPDLFGSLNDVYEAFEEFAHNIKSNGLLLINGDDENLLKLKNSIQKDIRIVAYGRGSLNDYRVAKIVASNTSTMFTVFKKEKEIGVFLIHLLGEHNVLNALAVVTLLTELGYEGKKINECLKEFEGSKRRCEILGTTSGGALVIDDYGHHPLEISTTITSLKNSYTGKKLVCIFQPHTYSRTKAFLSEFGAAFNGVHKLLLLPIFKSARDTEVDSVTQDELSGAHKKYVDTTFVENFEGVIEYVKQNYDSDEYVIVTIGAGDVYKIAESLAQK